MTICTTCGDDIEESEPTPEEGYGEESYAPAQTEYEGDLYRFCCSEHREAFEEDPEQYL
jgi:hypothetical protein